jgi:GTPase Era involved in 16S rRNA processing
MSQYQENIHIAILGPVSAGKSTLLNALFSSTFSDMKRKKTTMLPQIYQTTNKNDIDTAEIIKERNQKSNKEILELRESGKYNDSYFKELIHKVKPIEDFINLPDKNASYSVLDMCGLNDDDCQIYYNYIKKISHTIDIYVLVFDINSPLNRTDEIKILQEITNHIKTNKHGYVHILINKCDDINFDSDDKFKFDDEELQEAYDACIIAVDKHMKDIRNKVFISPLRSSQLYVYRAARYNIDSLDEKQIDNIIKEEAGKVELAKLKSIENKKKYLKGLITNKQLKLEDGWMRATGYNLFCNSINKIMTNYQEIIQYHIEQDVDKILDPIEKSQGEFDETTIKLEEINNRFKNLVSTYDNKCKVEEIIPQSIQTKLDQITQSMNSYLVTGLNTYTGNTRENAESFITKIGKFFTKVSSLFRSNPLAASEEKLKLKRIELINNNLVEKYVEQDFTELYTTKTIDLTKYTQCVANTIDKNFMKFDKLLESVKKITNNDEKFMNVIINKFTSSYKQDTTFDEFLKNLEIIANTTNNNLDVIWTIIECQLKAINNTSFKGIYGYWITLNSVNILQETDEIKYIIFKINNYVISLLSNQERFDTFKQHMNNIQNLYNLLTKLVGKKTDDYFDFSKQQIKNINQNNLPQIENSKFSKNNLITTDDEFLDATEGEKTETEVDLELESEKSDTYNDSDDSDTVFRKATKNTSVRTTKRINKGAKVIKVSK